MANKRYINTKFWDDSYIIDLETKEKLLFLYFITNSMTDLSGVYEISLQRVAFDTGLEKSEILEILKKFEKDKKIYWLEGWVYIKNFSRHQSVNENMRISIEKSLENVPGDIVQKIQDKGIPFETLSNAFEPLLEIEKNKNRKEIEKEKNIEIEKKAEPTPAEQTRDFFTSSELQEKVALNLNNQGMDLRAAQSIVREFIDYWTEPTKSGRKVRWELESTFDIKRRLTTWLRNAQKFNKSGNGQQRRYAKV